MENIEIPKKLVEWRERHKKNAWRPIVSKEDKSKQSKFAGIPFLKKNETWPKCGECDSLLQFFLQLHLDELPSELETNFGSGLLQFFYCTSDCRADLWEPFSKAHLVRVVKIQEPNRNIELPKKFADVTCKTIIGWGHFEDLPHPEEHGKLGLKYNYDFKKDVVHIVDTVNNDTFSNLYIDIAEEITEAKSGDKLAGWPYWIQNVEYPSCPQCNKCMQHVFQVDSEDNVPFMFGDSGCGHITQCPDHKDVVAFAWACC